MGVPQGSIMPVTLFLVKIHCITQCLILGVDCSLYVDDFQICYRLSNMRIIERQLQLCLNKHQQWATDNGFRFSKIKTVCMHICQKRNLHLDPHRFQDKGPILVVEETKFRGVIFDRRLSFVPHLKYVKKKGLKTFKVIGNTVWGADRKVMLRLYRYLVRFKLDYGCIVYVSARKSAEVRFFSQATALFKISNFVICFYSFDLSCPILEILYIYRKLVYCRPIVLPY